MISVPLESRSGTRRCKHLPDMNAIVLLIILFSTTAQIQGQTMVGQMVGGSKEVPSEEVDEVLQKLHQNIHLISGENLK